jgi:hypothetical protein
VSFGVLAEEGRWVSQDGFRRAAAIAQVIRVRSLHDARGEARADRVARYNGWR